MKPKGRSYLAAFSSNSGYRKPSFVNSPKYHKSPEKKFHSLKGELIGPYKTSNNNLDKAKRIVDFVAKHHDTPYGRLILGAVSNGVQSLINNSHDTLSYHSSESTASIDETKVHIIRFNVGRTSTSTVSSAARINGSSTIQLSNSLSDCKVGLTRSLLSRSFGFNQKSFDFLGYPFTVTVKDYEPIYNILEWKVPEHGNEVPYGLLQEEYVNVKIRNSNTYHKLNFKIHVIKILDDDVTMSNLYRQCFNKMADIQNGGCIPAVYQITDRKEVTNFVDSVLCYNGCSIGQAPAFKTQAKLVKTFSKKLNPGDTLDFRMKQHCGSGLRIDIARKYMLSKYGQGDQPSSYGIIVEATGTPCEGMRFSDESIFQGTCPGWYNYEYTKGIKVVKDNSLTTESEYLSGGFKKGYAIKIHERELMSEPPITFASWEIGKPGEKDKNFAILSTSDERVVYSGKINSESSEFKEVEEDFDKPYPGEE